MSWFSESAIWPPFDYHAYKSPRSLCWKGFAGFLYGFQLCAQPTKNGLKSRFYVVCLGTPTTVTGWGGCAKSRDAALVFDAVHPFSRWSDHELTTIDLSPFYGWINLGVDSPNRFFSYYHCFSNMRSWRSWIARVTPTHKAAGSNPVGRTMASVLIAFETL